MHNNQRTHGRLEWKRLLQIAARTTVAVQANLFTLMLKLFETLQMILGSGVLTRI